MTFGIRGPIQSRTRMGLVFLLIGVVLLLWAWISWIYRAADPGETGGVITKNISSPSPAASRAFLLSPMILLIALLLVLLVLFGSHVLIRLARRYRALADRRRPTPTPSDDVWAMNRLRKRDEEEI